METKRIQNICVYCGSADGVNPVYIEAAFEMGQAIARAGLKLVYGAGKTGLMGAVANGVLQTGGEVTGVVPVYLNEPHLIHSELTRLEVVDNIHQRKARMSELADAFIALPGGYGTFEELFETLTWAQLGLHDKPIGLLNTRNYFDPMTKLVEHTLNEGFIYAEHRTLLMCSSDPNELLAKLQSYEKPQNLDRWVTRQ
ncbi:MAG: TIGR00730 family Rossman fold protein [Chloroflexi bacterium]|nr:TIGR00730 family Rossman fold protein [Chloroflexota bacterium]